MSLSYIDTNSNHLNFAYTFNFIIIACFKLWIWSQSRPTLIKVFCSSTCQGQRMGVNWQTCLLLSLHFTRCHPTILCYASISSTLRKYFPFNSKTYLLFSQFTSHATLQSLFNTLQWHKYFTHVLRTGTIDCIAKRLWLHEAFVANGH